MDDINLELEEWIYSTREFIAHRVRQALIRLGEQLLSKDLSQAATIIASFVWNTSQRDERLPRKPKKEESED